MRNSKIIIILAVSALIGTGSLAEGSDEGLYTDTRNGAAGGGKVFVPEMPLAAAFEEGIPLEALARKISFFLVYPEEANQRGWEGIAKIRFTINEDGAIQDAEIAESCGYPLLDKTALWAVQNASLYPFPLNKKVSLTLPIEFKAGGASQLVAAATKPAKPQKTQEKQAIPQEMPEEIPKKTSVHLKSAKAGKKDIIPLEEVRLEDLVSESFPVELKDIARIAMDNYQPLQVAKEEMELADIKIKEAKRNTFSAVKLQVYQTEGDIYDVDYEEEEARINLNHPLYYGGRLHNAVKQAEVNWEITRENYDRELVDLIHKTEVAYYNLIALEMDRRKQEELIAESSKILEVIERQHSVRAIIALDFRSAQSSYKQLQLLRDSIEQEIEMAKLTLQQVLNVQEPPQVTYRSLRPTEFAVNLDDCVAKGLTNRPEVYLAQLNVAFNEYGEKVEKGKDKWNVDLTTYYGYYRGHFLTEPKGTSKNWYVGLQAIKPLGANTLTTSITNEAAEPRFGETTATGARTISAQFDVLNNYKKVSDIKTAEVSLSKAKNELNETEKSVTFEVQDSFLNYKKSLLELKSSLSLRDFKEEKVLVTKIRANAGEDSFSRVMDALVELSGAENTYLRALGNYYISLSNLRKATGYGLKI